MKTSQRIKKIMRMVMSPDSELASLGIVMLLNTVPHKQIKDMIPWHVMTYDGVGSIWSPSQECVIKTGRQNPLYSKAENTPIFIKDNYGCVVYSGSIIYRMATLFDLKVFNDTERIYL